MSKKVDFKRLSDKRCVVCKKQLKKNLVDKNPRANMCYRHYQMIVRKHPSFPMDHSAKVFTNRKNK